jgi:hypothetical protein
MIPFSEFIGSLFYKLLIMFFFLTYCRIMDSTDNDNVGSLSIVGTQNPSSTLPQKPKKCEQTSMVWEHFTKVENGDPEDPKSKCNYCNKLFSCHTKRLGTSSMLSHLKNSCKKYPGRFDKSVKKGEQMAVGEGSIGNLVITKYNAEKIKVTGTEPENFMGGGQQKKKNRFFRIFLLKKIFLLFFKLKAT